MVCMICNGKGYIVEKGKEISCPECQGRGEDFVLEGVKLPTFAPHKCAEPPCPETFVG